MSQAASGIGIIGETSAGVISQDVNAKALDSQGRSIIDQAAFDERQQRRASSLSMGQAIAQGAGSGVAITSGSPLLQELDRVKQNEIEALSIRRQGQIGQMVTHFQSRMTRKQIPFTILGGTTKLLSQGADSVAPVAY